jgi:hypothetical protein
MKLEVTLGQPITDLLPDIFTPIGAVIEGPPGTTVTYVGRTEYRSVDIAPLLEFVIQFGAGVSSTLVAAWIIEKFRGRGSKVTINRREIDFDDEGQIRRIVDEEITFR